MKCCQRLSGGRQRGCIVSPLPVLASTGPLIEGVVILAALVLMAILIRNP
jgi:hypothetical protein